MHSTPRRCIILPMRDEKWLDTGKKRLFIRKKLLQFAKVCGIVLKPHGLGTQEV